MRESRLVSRRQPTGSLLKVGGGGGVARSIGESTDTGKRSFVVRHAESDDASSRTTPRCDPDRRGCRVAPERTTQAEADGLRLQPQRNPRAENETTQK